MRKKETKWIQIPLVSAKNFFDTLQKIATETEKTNQTFMKQWRGQVEQWRCFRFNVSHGLDKVGIEEYKQQSLISAAAATYIQDITTMGAVRMCVHNLRKKQCMYYSFLTTLTKKATKSEPRTDKPNAETGKKLLEEAKRREYDQKQSSQKFRENPSRSTSAETSK